MVEIFDAHETSFVSVTQQFNTTSSMGRLTLNVLLSFAQFEREVTAERIRDKIAASKRKGMWMGGVVPLGYDAVEKRRPPFAGSSSYTISSARTGGQGRSRPLRPAYQSCPHPQQKSAEFPTLRALARSVGRDRPDVDRRIRLAFLAPDIVAAIVAGEQPKTLTIGALLRDQDIPLSWAEQRRENTGTIAARCSAASHGRLHRRGPSGLCQHVPSGPEQGTPRRHQGAG